jgi:16S rRNA (cytosine967-C5)-methyltransferase
MTPNARLKSTIELLEQIQENTKKPADVIMQSYFKSRRFIGGSDRRAIGDMVFAILRHYHGLSSALNSDDARLLTFFYLQQHENYSLVTIESLCDGEYAPEPLSNFEKKCLIKHASYNKYLLPDWVKEYVPEGLVPFIFQQALVDVRVNTLKNNREFVSLHLKSEGYELTPTPFSPLGLRFFKRLPLNTHELWKDGTLEVQEEASQIAVLLCDAKPNMNVLDYCAGVGGKSLALAATMQNKGRLILSDIFAFRLKRAKERIRRAGVSNYQIKDLNQESAWFKRHHNYFDRVLVDAPCSGSGTWRRNPDLKMRFTQQDLEELLLVQKDILNKASLQVKAGGRMIYVTCSFLEAENIGQINKFLKYNNNFKVVPIQNVWGETIVGNCPFTTEHAQFLTNLHGTDCFFVCVLEKQN